MGKRTEEQKQKHAEYMRKYYAEHPGYKAAADKKHRQKYIAKLLRYDRQRNLTPERKEQQKIYQRKRREEKVDEARAYAHSYYQKHKERYRAALVARREMMKQDGTWQKRSREYMIRHAYGISIDKYDQMFTEQGGVCAICGYPAMNGRKLHIDHDHKTGVVRGLLCVRCNNAIERMDKCPDWHEKAEMYLRKPR
jgi:hypothetical protein